MKATGSKDMNMAKQNILHPMGTHIMENGFKEKNMDRESTYYLMEASTLGNLYRIRKKDMVYFIMLMGNRLRENGLKMKKTVKEH